jgi:hypothetical protein
MSQVREKELSCSETKQVETQTITIPLSAFNEVVSTLKFAANNSNWVIATEVNRVCEQFEKLRIS